MDDNRDGATPPDMTPEPDKSESRSWYIDKNGNLKGPVFSFSSENYQLFTDEAVTDPAALAALRKSAG